MGMMNMGFSISALALVVLAAACGEGDAAARDAVVVTCAAADTTLSAPAVDAQRDGVHIAIDNRSGQEQTVYFRLGDDFWNQRAAPGLSDVVSPRGPGEWRVVCTPPSAYPGDDAAWVMLEVRDPGRLWIAADPDCAHPTSLHPDYKEYFEGGLPVGTKGDPLAIATAERNQWDPTGGRGEVELAGYPDASPRTFRIVEDGEVIAIAEYRDDGRGGWFFGSVSWCEDDGRA